MPVNLLNYDEGSLSELVVKWGERPFRARQLMKWIYQEGELNVHNMTNIAQSFRKKLAQEAVIALPKLLSEYIASDGTHKWLLDMGSGNGIETVFIPEDDRGTLCISSQVGCALECAFCSTGRQGFNRNLTTAEIIGQVVWANQRISPGSARLGIPTEPVNRIVSNVVFMGMGEPLANFDSVLSTLRLLLNDHALGLSRRRVTVSTSGLVPGIDRLRALCPVSLAVSLHAPNDTIRDQLVPINQKYPLKMLLAACQRYLEAAPRDFITMEYVMLAGVNDQPKHAHELAAVMQALPCKFNLIPFNPFPNSGFQRSDSDTIFSFRDILMKAGYVVTIRKTRGEKIDAACGQLAGQVLDKTHRVINKMKRHTTTVS